MSLGFFTSSMCAQPLSGVQLFGTPLSTGFSVHAPLPGSSVHGILQAGTLEWVAMPSSRGSSQPRDQTQVFHVAGRFSPSELPAMLPGLTQESAISCWSARQLRHWGLAGCWLGCLGHVSLSFPSGLAWAGTPGEGFPAKPERASLMAQALPSFCDICFSLTGVVD